MSVKIDLVTGFLGSGKTTFIKKYASYLISKGERIGILENDYGAVNVDMMLLQDLRGPSCELEMIAGGCDYDCHVRRFKTKLISMAMSGYTRVIVEPSGIFDTDEFFDLIYDDPLDSWYEMGNVITLVDAKNHPTDEDSLYLFAGQLASSGIAVVSKVTDEKEEDLREYLNQSMNAIGCIRKFDKDILTKNFKNYTDEDYERIRTSGYHSYSYEKKMVMENNHYSSLYFMNLRISLEELKNVSEELFSDKTFGSISRVKGFLQENGVWYSINVTSESVSVLPVENGQNVFIIIGENLNEETISGRMAVYNAERS